MRAGADYIIPHNVNDYEQSPVKAIIPEELVIVGSKKALAYAVGNVTVSERNTLLKERIRRLFNNSDLYN